MIILWSNIGIYYGCYERLFDGKIVFNVKYHAIIIIYFNNFVRFDEKIRITPEFIAPLH